MKKIFLAVALLFSAPAYATDASMCPKIGELAAKVMKARQLGIPKQTVLGVITPGPAERIATSLVELAYVTPVYPNDYMKNTAIESFQMQAEYTCYQNFTY